MNLIRFWLKNSRYTALPQSLLPAVLALCMAASMPGFSILPGLAAVVGVALGHLGMNLFDDYFDYRKKGTAIRDKLASEGIRARIAKCDYLTSGKATVGQLFVAASVFCLLSLVIGLFIWMERGAVILYLSLAAAFLGISYSGYPFRFSYRGFGELLVGVLFGPLLMVGVYYSACGEITPSVLLISVPVGLLVANVLFTHSIMDYEPDKRVGKMTLAVLLVNKRCMLIASALFIFIPFGVVLYGVIAGYLSLWYLSVLLTLPMAVSLFYLMIQFVRDPQRLFSPRFWMGKMENWQGIKAAGIDWFMIRWYLSRNLLSFFCLIIILVSFIV